MGSVRGKGNVRLTLNSFLDAIFRVEPGRMRNAWYPKKKAEYMTATRFQEMGLTRQDIGERDRAFGATTPEPLEEEPEGLEGILETLVAFDRRLDVAAVPVINCPPPLPWLCFWG
jgi:Ribosomal protein L9, N-terminal domain